MSDVGCMMSDELGASPPDPRGKVLSGVRGSPRLVPTSDIRLPTLEMDWDLEDGGVRGTGGR